MTAHLGERRGPRRIALLLTALVGAGSALLPAVAAAADDGTAPEPAITVSDPSVLEGNTATTDLTFTVSGYCPAAGDGLHCLLSAGTAIGGTADLATDFISSGISVDIDPGPFTRTLAVPVVGDTTVEPDETVLVEATLYQSNPTGPATRLVSASNFGTILDDDQAPPPVTATCIRAVSGGGQTAKPREAFSQPLVAQVTDQSGQGVPGEVVTFTVTGPARFPGNAGTATATTGPDGTATSPVLTAGTSTGPVTVKARATGIPGSATFYEKVQTPPPPRADLRIRISAPSTSVAGSPVTVTITITNSGPAAATGVSASFTVPGGVRITQAGGGTVTGGGTAARFHRSTLASGSTAAWTVTITPGSSFRGSASLCTSVASATTDPALGNNATSATLRVTGPRRS